MKLLKTIVDCDHDGGKGEYLVGDTVLCHQCMIEFGFKREDLLGPKHVAWW